MSDALNRNVPKGHAVVEANCTARARRGIVDQYPNFPAERRHVLKLLHVVFSFDALCKQYRLSPEERLLVHQRESQPMMDELRAWMTSQLGEKARRVRIPTSEKRTTKRSGCAWMATEEELQGLVIYLRSLEPKSHGALDFNGALAASGAAGSGE